MAVLLSGIGASWFGERTIQASCPRKQHLIDANAVSRYTIGMNTKNPTIITTLRLPSGLVERITAARERRGILTLAEVYRTALVEWVERDEARTAIAKEGAK